MVKTVLLVGLGLGAGLLILHGVAKLLEFIRDVEIIIVDQEKRLQRLERMADTTEVRMREINQEK